MANAPSKKVIIKTLVGGAAATGWGLFIAKESEDPQQITKNEPEVKVVETPQTEILRGKVREHVLKCAKLQNRIDNLEVLVNELKHQSKQSQATIDKLTNELDETHKHLDDAMTDLVTLRQAYTKLEDSKQEAAEYQWGRVRNQALEGYLRSIAGFFTNNDTASAKKAAETYVKYLELEHVKYPKVK